MSYIGNSPTTQSFTPAVDYFSGNGVATSFTLSRSVASVYQIEAIVNNVVQNPSTAYTVSSNTITFTGAPSTGTNNVYVKYISLNNQTIAPGQGTVYTSSLSLNSVTGTGNIVLSSGGILTTANVYNAASITTSGSIGIGTTSPVVALDVNGGGQIRAANYFALNNTDNTNQYYFNNSGASGANNAVLQLSATNIGTVMTWQGGNLGLGVTPSAWSSIDRAIEGYAGSGFDICASGATPLFTMSNTYRNSSSAWTYKANGYAYLHGIAGNGNSTGYQWFIAPSGTAGGAISWNQAMTLDNSGNLGIGTTTPSNYVSGSGLAVSASGVAGVFLSPSGTSQVNVATFRNSTNNAYTSMTSAGSASSVSAWTNGSQILEFVPYSSGNGIISAYTGALTFQINGRAEAGRFDTSGNFMVGATSYAGKLTIASNGYLTGQFTDTASTKTTPIIQAAAYATGSTSWYALVTQSGNGSSVTANTCFIYGNGNLVNVNNSYGVMSDAKLKDNITAVASQWDDVKALSAAMSKFTLKSDPDQKVHLGWIAQDVQKISPGLVFEHTDSDLVTNEPTGTTTLGVNTSVAMLKAYKALGEAMERIEALEAKLKAAGIQGF